MDRFIVHSHLPLDVFRAGRLLRLIRLLRIVRAFKSTHLLVHHIFKNRAQGAVATASVVGVMMIVFSAIAILQVETDPTSKHQSAEDAIWWAITTITTVGYEMISSDYHLSGSKVPS
ncbi:MAG: two pore domain potassium channel family protein [Saprospiraceae bacterium]|nr:two pore domain potassium channel family protein [Saprospiraceae bacterium]